MIIDIAIYIGLAIGLILAVTLFIYVYARLSAQQRSDFNLLAAKAISLVEQEYGPSNGEEKMSAAIDLLDSWINNKFHTKFTPEQLKAALQFAFDNSPLKHPIKSADNK
ncbi:hypothetical protein [Sporolactobacillus pectinivorans]|uniref:hypothetical protein n=1 Tax=Sporolactobacillus pectinivorans TaxID=1591408 RepID=UPI0012FE38FE|nr:hypothetical protein [Sporolactobacillus pectinivorans]